MEVGSIFNSIKAYYYIQEKCSRKRIMPLVFEYILEIRKDHTFLVSLGINENKLLVKLNWC